MSLYKSKQFGDVKVKINSFSINKAFVLNWQSDKIGFGQYTIYVDDGRISAQSEHMDSNDSKKFLRALLVDLAEQIYIDD